MRSHRALLRAVLGLLILCDLSFYAAGQSSAESRCEQATKTFETERAACEEHKQQLFDVQNQIAFANKQREDLLLECRQAKPQDKKACEERAELLGGRVLILQQSYTTLAQTGCQQTVNSVSLAKLCTSGATPADLPARQNKLHVPNNGANSPAKGTISVTKDQQQVPRTNDGSGNALQGGPPANQSGAGTPARTQPVAAPQTPMMPSQSSGARMSAPSDAGAGAGTKPPK